MVRVFESRALLWNVGTSTFLQSEVFLWSASGVQEQLCFWSTILCLLTKGYNKLMITPNLNILPCRFRYCSNSSVDLICTWIQKPKSSQICAVSHVGGWLELFILLFRWGGRWPMRVIYLLDHEGVLKILHPQKLFFSFPKMEKKADVVLPRVLRPWTCSLTACRKGRHGLASLLVIRHFWSSLNLAFLQQNLQPLVLNGCFHSQHYSSVKATVDGRTLESTVFEKPGQNVPVTHTTTSLSKSWATSLCSVLGLWSFTS